MVRWKTLASLLTYTIGVRVVSDGQANTGYLLVQFQKDRISNLELALASANTDKRYLHGVIATYKEENRELTAKLAKATETIQELNLELNDLVFKPLGKS